MSSHAVVQLKTIPPSRCWRYILVKDSPLDAGAAGDFGLGFSAGAVSGAPSPPRHLGSLPSGLSPLPRARRPAKSLASRQEFADNGHLTEA